MRTAVKVHVNFHMLRYCFLVNIEIPRFQLFHIEIEKMKFSRGRGASSVAGIFTFDNLHIISKSFLLIHNIVILPHRYHHLILNSTL